MVIKVLVIDDSALMRSVLSEVINSAPDLEVVGSAPDPIAAREMIKTLNPDVLTLDIEMPKMDGLDFLARLMRLRPMPVVMISSLTRRGSEATLQALELGAVDFVPKPRLDSTAGIEAYRVEICDKVRCAFGARPRVPVAPPPSPKPLLREPLGQIASAAGGVSERALHERLVLIGASTGGTEAIKEVLCSMPEHMPAILMVQHMPEMFTASFAKRLDGLCRLRVKEAEHGERVVPGTAYLAPGHSHLSVRRVAGGYQCELAQSEPVNRHRPAVDVLFQSAATQVGANGVGVILTGMGKDGAQGLLAMRQAGAWTIGQDQESCVVYGMPREAAAIGALDEVAPLREVGLRVLNRLRMTDKRGIKA
ncbi:chemotaxis response regulator protein-glutamate methylesterase [Zoogloea sp.]|uniref:protein-glutamate methylesterase/protein-glutamine glutaminase n=1 Tax=Zoogloea sp. TaxID=49181 RepID=UPI0025E39854|nr:chemotaxis response regulator protein-glutamate methylesterase [Zoogloea sp.]MCK6396078.1 chemotaxis response regulator protein-glutamate methylesterase [Zoogloea sp.]